MTHQPPADKYQWLCTMRDGGAVQRFHTKRLLCPQRVDSHSWGVMLVLMAAGCDNINALAYAALHDTAEQFTGDVPRPAKRAHPPLDAALTTVEAMFEEPHGITALRDSLSLVELDLIAWADVYELVQYAAEEVRMGNTFMLAALNNGYGAVEGIYLKKLRSTDYGDAVADMTNQLANDVRGYLEFESIYDAYQG